MLNEIITHAEIKQALVGMKRPFFAHFIYFLKNKNNRLDLIIEGLLQTKKIETPTEGISYIAKLIPDEVLKNTKKVNWGDFGYGSTSSHLAKKLVEKINGQKNRSDLADMVFLVIRWQHNCFLDR